MQLELDRFEVLPVGEVLSEFELHESLTFYTWVLIGCPVTGVGVVREGWEACSGGEDAEGWEACEVTPCLAPVRARRASPLARELARSRELARMARMCGAIERASDLDLQCAQIAGLLIGGALQ